MDETTINGQEPAMFEFWPSVGIEIRHTETDSYIPRWLDHVHDTAMLPGNDSIHEINEALKPLFRVICTDLTRYRALYRLGGTFAVLDYAREELHGA